MRHRLQSRQVVIGVALAILMSAVLCAAVALILMGPFPEGITASRAQLFTHHSAPAAPPASLTRSAVLVQSAVLLALLGYQVAATFLLNDLFRRTSAGEAFFLLSYVVSLSLEVVRLVAVIATVRGLAPSLAVAATRVVYMGRLFGLASLFLAALCSLGMRYGDYAVLSGAGLLVAVAMGTVVPVDSSSLTTGLAYAVSDGGGLLSVSATGLGIVALGSLAAPLVRQERSLVGYAAAVLCLLLGRELLSLGALVPSLAGTALLVGGTYLASRALERVYLRIS